MSNTKAFTGPAGRHRRASWLRRSGVAVSLSALLLGASCGRTVDEAATDRTTTTETKAKRVRPLAEKLGNAPDPAKAAPKMDIQTSLMIMTKAWVQYQPRGRVLIIAPWNYPLNLCFGPLVSALAAGNTVIIKPSEMMPSVSKVMACLLYTSPSPRDRTRSRMPSSA